MYAENHTPFPSAIFPSSEPLDRVTTLAVTAATYRLDGGALAPSLAQQPLQLAPGPIPNDRMHLKAGVSVCATGFVYPKEGEAKRAAARLAVGDHTIDVAVFGVRVWQRSALGGGLVPSAPLPFRRVEMSWKNAFGGAVLVPSSLHTVDGEEAILPEHEEAYPFNFDGTGFYPDEARALHQPLPQIEHPEQLVRRWDDRPEPTCFAPYPVYGGLRAGFVLRDGEVLDPRQAGKLASRAAPRATFDVIAPGTTIALEGMRPGGARIAFAVPPPPVWFDLRIGDRAERLVPALDAVDIDAEALEVRLVYRAMFTYDLVEFEVRRLSVEPSPELDVVRGGR